MVTTTPEYGFPLVRPGDRVRDPGLLSKLADDMNAISVRAEQVATQVSAHTVTADSVIRSAHNQVVSAAQSVGSVHDTVEAQRARLQVVEKRAALQPGGSTDNSVSALLAQPDSALWQALTSTYQTHGRGAGPPEDFGAAGNGITDDTTALQAWADAGGTLLSPGSTYKITRSIEYTRNHVIISGQDATINIHGDDSTNSVAIRIQGNHATVSGLRITGVGGKSQGGIMVNGDYATIRDNTISGFTSDTRCFGIGIVGRHGGNTIIKNTVTDLFARGNGEIDIGSGRGSSRAIYYHVPDNTVTKPTLIKANRLSEINGLEGDGIQILVYDVTRSNTPFGVAHVDIRENTVTGCSRRCIKVQASSVNVLNNVVDDGPSGRIKDHPSSAINAIRADNIVVAGNHVNFSQHIAGISVQGVEHPMQNIVIRDNRVTCAQVVSYDGIYVNSGYGTSITGNATDGGRRGVGLVRCVATIVAGNTARGIPASGVFPTTIAFHAQSNCEQVVFANNTDTSTAVHDSFVNLSSDGLSVNNISLTFI